MRTLWRTLLLFVLWTFTLEAAPGEQVSTPDPFSRGTGSACNPIPIERRALLNGVTTFDPQMNSQGLLLNLEFPGRDVLLLAADLEKAGQFTDIRITMSGAELQKQKALATLALKSEDSSYNQRQDASRILGVISRITQPPLERTRPFCHVPLVTLEEAQERPRASDLEATLHQFAFDLNEKDEALYYISSHGFLPKRRRGRLLDVGAVVVATADTLITHTEPRVIYRQGTAITLSEVLETLETSACKRILVIQATCAAGQTLTDKGTGAENQKVPDRDSASVTVIGAAKEFAYETQVVEGDLFTWFFRLAFAGRLRELGPEWANVDPDINRDGAISVMEAYDVAEVGVRRATALTNKPQLPYVVQSGGQTEPFLLTGASGIETHSGTVYPRLPARLLLRLGEKKSLGLVLRGSQLQNGKLALDEPTAVPPGNYVLELHERTQSEVGADGTPLKPMRDRVVGRRRVRVQENSSVRVGDVWREPDRLELSLGPAQWLGPSSWPEGDPHAGNVVWSGSALELGLAHDILNTPDDLWSLQAGVRLHLGSSAPVAPGQLHTLNTQAGVGLDLSMRRELYGRLRTELDTGIHALWFLLSSYSFRKTLLVPGPGGHLGLAWDLGLSHRVMLRLAGTVVYADLDCRPVIQDWDGSDAEVNSLQALLPQRCQDEDQDGQYEEAPTLNALTQLQLGWQWRF